MTWAELSDTCATAFNHLHGPGRFYPNQEPLLGTWQCRFCDVSFLGKQVSSPEFHSLMCEAHRLAPEAHKTLQRGDPTAVERCPMGGGCSYSLKGIADLSFKSHLSTSRHYSSDVEPTYICRNHSTPLVLHSWYDYTVHAVTCHSAPSTIVPTKPTSWEALLYFCRFCQVLIPRADELEEHHLQAHLDSGDATASIVDHGFVGVERNGQWTHPGFCIFCLYDTRLSALRRFMVWSSTQALFAHVTDEHVGKITDPVCCPAAGVSSTPEGLPHCVDTGIFDAAGMSEHLNEMHGYQYRSSKKAAPSAKPGDKRKSALAVEKAPEEEMLAGDPSSDVVQASGKKVKTGGGRQPLVDLDVNQAGKQL